MQKIKTGTPESRQITKAHETDNHNIIELLIVTNQITARTIHKGSTLLKTAFLLGNKRILDTFLKYNENIRTELVELPSSENDDYTLHIGQDGNASVVKYEGTSRSSDGPVYERTEHALSANTVSIAATDRGCLMVRTNGTIEVWPEIRERRSWLLRSIRKAKRVLRHNTLIPSGLPNTVIIRNDDSAWGLFDEGRGVQDSKPCHLMDDVLDVHCGAFFFMFLTKTGEVYTMGANHWGQLGTGESLYVKAKKPVRILDNVRKITGGAIHGMALKNDGTVWMWGGNPDGQIGIGTINETSTPLRILNGITDIAACEIESYALCEDGTLFGWGTNNDYALVSGITQRRTITRYPYPIGENIQSLHHTELRVFATNHLNLHIPMNDLRPTWMHP